jgi:hypothetical protein
MSTQQQIDANRENAQSSTGPTTEAGKKQSSLNSTVHGFTGQRLVISDSEKARYEYFSAGLLAEHKPQTIESRELLQNYIDLRWSIQQITVQQNNILAIIDDLTAQFIESGNIAGLDAALEPSARRLKTLGTYEQRRRRAAAETFAQFIKIEKDYESFRDQELERGAKAHAAFKKLGQTWDPQEFGFVHALPEIEKYVAERENAELLEILTNSANESIKAA